MKQKIFKTQISTFPLIYELTLWFLYVCLLKYSFYVDVIEVKTYAAFPHPQIILYAIAMSLYWILYYRLAASFFLKKRKYGLLFFTAILFVVVLSIPNNFIVSGIFKYSASDSSIYTFYASEFNLYKYRLGRMLGWSFEILLPDLIAFSSIAFVRFAFENEYKKRVLESQNFQLQIDSLKAQLNPHFLFNTLNSLYGMSLLSNKETPDFILRMADTMRYILYDSSAPSVLLEKEVEFIENYLSMENKRFSNLEISFSAKNIDETTIIAPLILFPFVENAIKHSAHHLEGKFNIICNIELKKCRLFFEIENQVAENKKELTESGGVGIKNVKARLEIYYPDKYELKIIDKMSLYKIELMVDLNLQQL